MVTSQTRGYKAKLVLVSLDCEVPVVGSLPFVRSHKVAVNCVSAVVLVDLPVARGFSRAESDTVEYWPSSWHEYSVTLQ